MALRSLDLPVQKKYPWLDLGAASNSRSTAVVDMPEVSNEPNYRFIAGL